MRSKTNEIPVMVAQFHRALSRWYGEHGRSALPWRNTRDPYRIYVSEIMLQQTQVKTVLERYYSKFFNKFPTLAALAAASPQEVMKQWEGLGYYSRAANLHAAARECAGILPQTPEALLALPGIGRNTAYAVACFAFGAAVPVMEANVRRVLYRVFALRKASEQELWEKAHQLLDKDKPYEYNQAMMDIGALVCTKRNPRCGVCPLSGLCEGKASPDSYPAPKKKKTVPVRRRVIVVFAGEGGRYYLARRQMRFLNGLYGFLEYGADVEEVSFMGKRHALGRGQLLGAVTQAYSHFTLEAKVYLVKAGKGRAALPSGAVFATLKQMQQLPLSRADQKIMQMLKERAPL